MSETILSPIGLSDLFDLQRPVWMVQKVGGLVEEKVDFGWIFSNKEKIHHVALLFVSNSYRVYPKDHVFVINGGRATKIEDFSEVELVCIERHQQDLAVGVGDIGIIGSGFERVSYLLGFWEKDGEQQLYIHISSDGSTWQWEDRR